jgi:hypothetical protein
VTIALPATYWASIQPSAALDDGDALCRGIEAVRAPYLRWLSTHGIEDLSVDGPVDVVVIQTP